MTKILRSSLLLSAMFSTAAIAQDCSELFISEYIEGSGNNKGVEFYNPTSDTLDLSVYSLQRWSNGEAAMTDETQLFGTLAPYGTWVLINGQTEDVELGGGNISPACDSIMQTHADQLDNPYPAPTYMNGDDALVLMKNGTTVVDIFGKPGEDPGTAWTDDEANGFVDVGDGATWLTSNHTLIRKSDVLSGVSTPPVSFNTFLEWDTLPVNTWDHLGWHTCLCEEGSVNDYNGLPELTIFPNPVAEGDVTISTESEVERIEVFNLAGKLVESMQVTAGARTWNVNSNGWDSGLYFVSVSYAKGPTVSQRLVVR